MKNATTVLADAPTTSLKIAYSYLLPHVPGAAVYNQLKVARPSPYKALFVVHHAVANPAAWDADWFGNYE